MEHLAVAQWWVEQALTLGSIIVATFTFCPVVMLIDVLVNGWDS